MSNTQTVIIRVRSDGTRVVTREVNDMGSAADRTANSFSKLKSLIAGVVTGVVVNQIRQLADTYTMMQNKLRLTTTDQANLNAVFKELNEISTRTRSSLETNVSLYSRLAVTTKDLGVSQKDVLEFTESLNKAVKLSGATAVEADNAIIQLTQGLASGALRGDELRSVLEQLPAVADVIAKGLSVTRGELRKMGEQGKITAEVVLDSFKKAREELDTNFKKTVPTIAEGFVALKNQLLNTVGALDTASGSSAFLATGLVSISTTLSELTPEFVAFARAVSGTLDPMDKMSNFGKVMATVFATVYGTLKAVTSLISGVVLIAFKTVGKVIGGVVAAIQQVLAGDFELAFETVKAAGSDIATSFVEESNDAVGGAIDATSQMFTKINQIWDEGARNIQNRKNEVVGAVSELAGPSKINLGPTDAELKKLEKLRNELRGVLNDISPLQGAMLEMEKAQRILNDAREKGLITAEQEVQYLEALSRSYLDVLDPIGVINREMNEQVKLLGMSSREREVEAQVLEMTKSLLSQNIILSTAETQAMRDKLRALQELNEATKIQDQLLEDIIGKRRDFGQQTDAIGALASDPSSGFGKGDQAGAIMSILPPELTENTQVAIDAQIGQIQYMYEQIAILRDKNLIDEQTALSMRLKLVSQSFDLQTRNAQNFFSGLAGLMASENKKLFKIGQAAAIANASIKGGEAIMNALATPPWYVGAALAIGAAAQVYSQIAQIKATKPPGFMEGGYTGNGSPRATAGVVHGQEYVMNASATRRIGVGNLDALQSGAKVATRGSKGGGGGWGVNVNIKNYGTSKSFDVEQVSRDEIRIIARDEARAITAREAPRAVAADIGSANSAVSKAMARNTNTQRRR